MEDQTPIKLPLQCLGNGELKGKIYKTRYGTRLRPKLWARLPVSVLERVFGYLPTRELLSTVPSLSKEWVGFVDRPYFRREHGHLDNVNDAFGYLVLRTPRDDALPSDFKIPDTVLYMLGFEHETGAWHKLASLRANSAYDMVSVKGSHAGLVCFKAYGSRKSKLCVCNPLTRARRWVDVDPEWDTSREYELQILVDGGSTRDEYKLLYVDWRGGCYAVYESRAARWSPSKWWNPLLWDSKPICNGWRGRAHFTPCNGYFFTVVRYKRCTEHAVIAYDARNDMWFEVPSSFALLNAHLRFTPDTCSSTSLVAHAGVLYAVVCTRTIYYKDLVSIEIFSLDVGPELPNASAANFEKVLDKPYRVHGGGGDVPPMRLLLTNWYACAYEGALWLCAAWGATRLAYNIYDRVWSMTDFAPPKPDPKYGYKQVINYQASWVKV